MSFDAAASIPDPDGVAVDPVPAEPSEAEPEPESVPGKQSEPVSAEQSVPVSAEPVESEPAEPVAAEPVAAEASGPEPTVIEPWAPPSATELLTPTVSGAATSVPPPTDATSEVLPPTDATSVPPPTDATSEVPVFPAPPASSLFPPPGRRGRPKPSKRVLAVICGVVAAGLVAGLLVWAPWNPSPNAPASVSADSKTATTVTVSWPAVQGGAKPVNYLVLRDGKQAGKVPASVTSWTDQGLAPGTTHRYTVETVGGGQTSGPSVVATVTTLTPSPVGLSVTANYSQATLRWKPSPLGPTPSKYTIYNGSSEVMTLSGTTTSYVDEGQNPGTPYKYSVVAQWGSRKSKPSVPAVGSVLSPPLNSGVQVQVTPTYLPSGATGAPVGKAYSYSWSFLPYCEADSCTMDIDAKIPTAGGKYYPFSLTLVSNGAGYTGTFSRAKLTTCSTVGVSGTIKVTLSPNQGQVSSGAWGGWTGTAVLSSPYTSLGNGSYCPAANWNFSLSGNGQRGVAQPT
jgi:hypothetical protein